MAHEAQLVKWIPPGLWDVRTGVQGDRL